MAKYYGNIGYGETVETNPGVWTEKITDRKYRGNVLQDIIKTEPGNNLNDNLNIQNRLSIIADTFAYQNFHTIQYVEWMGAKWKVVKVEVKRPRLFLTIGGVYNG